ncbi:MAG: thioesterase family protein [Candidatus Nanopelagicales bacterium]|nr:thioesterase family protein [Candidatus Nanopelagicales bacterium]
MAEHDFADLLRIATLGEQLFSATPVGDGGHLFGGHTLGLAFQAASATVNPELWPQSLHANFIDAGRAGHELRMEVEPLRNSRAFAMRQVTVTQGEATPLLMQAAFHSGENGPDWQPSATLDVPDPESLESDGTFLFNMDPMDVRPLGGPKNRGSRPMVPHVHPFWVRPRVPLADDRMLHAAVVAFISDYMVVGTTQAPDFTIPQGSLIVTMEHALWFHRPVDANDWLLFTAEPLSVYHGRGLSRGTVTDRDGHLVASFVQEVLTRLPRE